jgi:Rad3-related DNA helicase
LIEYRCLDPSLAIQPVIEESHSALIMSGTLSPLKLFTDVLGIGNAEAKTYSAIAKPENIRTFIDNKVTTRFKERSIQMIRSYGERISRIVAKVPNGVLIFFPQRGLMLEAYRNWAENDILEKRRKGIYFCEKKVFIEGARASENAKIVDEYKEASKTGEGAALFAVFRGSPISHMRRLGESSSLGFRMPITVTRSSRLRSDTLTRSDQGSVKRGT